MFNHKGDFKPQPMIQTWDEVCLMLGRHQVKASKEWLPAWSPVKYATPHRSLVNVESVSMLVLDFDNGVDPEVFRKQWEDLDYWIHSTYSHAEGFAKWRALFPLVDPVPASQWPQVYHKLAIGLGRGNTDPHCSDSSRLYFLPACPAARVSMKFAYGSPGDWLNPDDFEDIPEEKLREFKAAHYTDREGRPLLSTGRVDFEAVAFAKIPKGQRHAAIIRAIHLARKMNLDKAVIQAVIESFHKHETDYGTRTRDHSLRYYLKDIDDHWATEQPDPRYVKEVA